MGEDNGKAVRMMAVPHRNPAGAVRHYARLNTTPVSAAAVAADPPLDPGPITRAENLARLDH